MPAKMDGGETTAVVILALGLALLATLYSSWRAARLDPVKSLRYGYGCTDAQLQRTARARKRGRSTSQRLPPCELFEAQHQFAFHPRHEFTARQQSRSYLPDGIIAQQQNDLR
jgi:hypothetical protein